MKPTTDRFSAQAKHALRDAELHQAVHRGASSFVARRRQAVAEQKDFEALRSFCAAVKAHTLDYLDLYLEQLADRVEQLGGKVHFAADGQAVQALVADLCRAYGVRQVVKAKSMLSEEIGLNDALQGTGIDVIETDLGEYILQLAGEQPSHIIAPALHKTREQIARLFHAQLGTPADATPEELAARARARLREAFLTAEMGISGVNFAVADTGSLVTVENEGNIRLSTSVPRVHVALMGVEKVIPRLSDLPAFLAVLTRSATGQKISSYVSIISGPKRPADPDGPEALHLVIVDNGRTAVLADPKLRSALRCIRCGACLNHCPVYEQIGGHAYGWVYPGPIGAVLDPGLLGLEKTTMLPQASSLCGACGEVCPVKIPLPELLIEHRRRAVERGLTTTPERLAMGAFGFLAKRPAYWNGVTGLGRSAGRLLSRDGYLSAAWLPALQAWLQERDFPAPAKRSFRQLWREGLRDEA